MITVATCDFNREFEPYGVVRVSLRFDLDLDTTRNLRGPLGLESLWVNRNLEKNSGFETLWVPVILHQLLRSLQRGSALEEQPVTAQVRLASPQSQVALPGVVDLSPTHQYAQH